MPVYASDGSSLGKAVEALIECRAGTVSYIVVATSMAIGADEKLRAVSRDSVAFNCDLLTLHLTPDEFEAMDVLKSDAWPASAEPIDQQHVTLGMNQLNGTGSREAAVAEQHGMKCGRRTGEWQEPKHE